MLSSAIDEKREAVVSRCGNDDDVHNASHEQGHGSRAEAATFSLSFSLSLGLFPADSPVLNRMPQASRRVSTSLPIVPGEQQIMSDRYDRATGRVAVFPTHFIQAQGRDSRRARERVSEF